MLHFIEFTDAGNSGKITFNVSQIVKIAEAVHDERACFIYSTDGKSEVVLHSYKEVLIMLTGIINIYIYKTIQLKDE